MADILNDADDFESLFSAQAATTQVPVSAPVGAGGLHVEKCSKCHGTGAYGRFGACYTCKGKGSKSFVAPASVRSANRAKSAERTKRAADEAVVAFTAAHPAEAKWLSDGAVRGDAFCTSLVQAIGKYGDLTDRQLSAATNAVARNRQRLIERAVSVAQAPEIVVDALLAAFATARDAGLKHPKIRLPGVTLSLASSSGKNPGAIYAKAPDGTYVGKISGGKFFGSYEASAEAKAAVLAALLNPLEQAVAYGRRTGQCSCCGRELTDPVSIERGIGPVCAERFGW